MQPTSHGVHHQGHYDHVRAIPPITTGNGPAASAVIDPGHSGHYNACNETCCSPHPRFPRTGGIVSMSKPAMIHFHTLEDTCRLYAGTMGLWLQYRETLGLDCLEYRYEDLISGFDTTVGRILDFLEIPWDKHVQAYHELARDSRVRTPSHQGITRPLYDSAVGKWRNYARHLAPFTGYLAPYIREFGYPAE